MQTFYEQNSSDSKLLDYYINKFNLTSFFTTDMRPYMKLVLFKRNEYICKSDEPIDSLYFFVEGKAKVYTPLSNGKSLLLCFYKPMMVIGDAEVLVTNMASSNLQTIEDSYCISIDFPTLRKHCLDDPRFLRYMSESLGSKLIRLSKYSSINILYPLENRLASYLLVVLSSASSASASESSSSSTSSSSSSQKGAPVDRHNLTEIAELLGTSYRHLLRTLNKLVDIGAIKKSNYFYEISDFKLLETMASDLYE